MPNRSRKQTSQPKRAAVKPRQRRDENETAFDVLQQIISRTEGAGKNPLAVALGRLGGLKGGHARAAKMSKDERRLSALKAARARWDQRKS